MIGFPIPNNIVHITANTNESWNYNDDKKIISCPISLQNKDIKISNEEYIANFDFGLVHEMCHALQYFVINNSIHNNNIDNLKFTDYEQMLNKFWSPHKIQVTQHDFNNFVSFIKDSPFVNQKLLNCLDFDNTFYVSGVSMFEDIKRFKIYEKNGTEIVSNYLATNIIYEFYKVKGKHAELFRALANKSKSHIGLIPGNIAKTKEDFDYQKSFTVCQKYIIAKI